MKPAGYLINTNNGLQGEHGFIYDYIMAENGVFLESRSPLIEARICHASVLIWGLAPVGEKAARMYESWRREGSDYSVPNDIKADRLDEYDMSQLNRLKDWIYQTRIQARRKRDKSERKQQKEEELTNRKAEQPALFEF